MVNYHPVSLLQYVVKCLRDSSLNHFLSSLRKVPQSSFQWSVLNSQPLVYINDLPDNLESLAKLFADDTSLFSIVYNPLLSADIMNKDLTRISKWADQLKMSFNTDITKQAQ